MGGILVGLMNTLSKLAIAAGVFMIAWGGVKIGRGIATENQDGAAVSNGFNWALGGAFVLVAAGLLSSIDMSWVG